MADLLLITTLDVLGRRNNREHHVIAHFKARFDRVTVVYRQRGKPEKTTGDLLRARIEKSVQGGVTYIGVDPMLNPPEGAARNFTAASSPTGTARKAVGLLIDTAGILRDWLTIRALAGAARTVCNADSVTVCEAFGPWAASAANILRREGRIVRYVYVDRDFEPGFMTSALRRAWAVRAEQRATASADLTLSIGHRLAARLACVPAAKVSLSPTGVDSRNFSAAPRTTPEPQLIFVGQVAPWSGIEESLDALALLNGEGFDARLEIFGPSDTGYRRALERQIGERGLAALVEWHGDCPRDQVGAALATASIGLATFRAHPLRIHAAPLKLLEYMASALPVIALEGSEAGDMVTRTGVGLTCATQGTDIARAVKAMLADPELYRRMSKAGPPAAAEHDWDLVLGREFDMLAHLYRLGAPALSDRRATA